MFIPDLQCYVRIVYPAFFIYSIGHHVKQSTAFPFEHRIFYSDLLSCLPAPLQIITIILNSVVEVKHLGIIFDIYAPFITCLSPRLPAPLPDQLLVTGQLLSALANYGPRHKNLWWVQRLSVWLPDFSGASWRTFSKAKGSFQSVYEFFSSLYFKPSNQCLL